MCEEDISTHERYTCASTVADFNVDKDGTTYITYQSVYTGVKGYERFVSTISASNFLFFCHRILKKNSGLNGYITNSQSGQLPVA